MAEQAASATELTVDNIRGAAWMVCSSACFAFSYAISKYLSGQLPPVEIAFFRCLFGLTVIAPFVIRRGLAAYRTTSPAMHLLRVGCATISLMASYYALAHLPFATAISLSFTRPLFMILIAMVFLNEKVRWRRGLATAVGFLGVLIVMGPHGVESLPGAGAALAGAAFVSGALAVVRRQAASDGPVTIMVWFATGTAITTALPALYVWQPPASAQVWMLLACMGVLGTLGQFFLVRAFVYGEATVMNPIDYSQILISAVVGYAVFDEIPAAAMWVGAAVIVGSTLYILLHESRLKKADS